MSQTSQSLTRRLIESVQPFPVKFAKCFQSLYDKPVTSVAVVIGLSAIGFGFWSFYDRYISLQTLILVAGQSTGESHNIGSALKEVVEKHQCHWQKLLTNITTGQSCLNFKIEIVETDGTQENLYALEGKLDDRKYVKEKTVKKLEGYQHAHLATAQADVVADQIGQSPTLSARTVVALYKDTFQLVVRNSPIPGKNDKPKNLYFILKGKKIGIPSLGGQRISFDSIAKQNGLTENDFTLVDTGIDLCSNISLDAVFRVRTLGNSEIQKSLSCGQLVPINQAAAMKIKHPAFQDNKTIPEGSYQGGETSLPSEEIKTIAVKRLLLARSDVPKQVIRELTEILNEYKPELANELKVKEDKPLVTQISEPGSGDSGEIETSGVSLHEGARDFYRRNEPPFFMKYSGYVSPFVTVVSFAIALLLRTHRQIKQESKDRADDYIKAVVDLMKKAELVELIDSHKKLEEEFQIASLALREDKISQESFRTFNEAYKTTREYIERAIETVQRRKSEQYIQDVMRLLDSNQTRPEVLLEQLEQILITAKNALTEDYVFSRESFRTFIEAHNVVREALNHRKEILQSSAA